jgi:ABC-type multidrug transport system fused ATPase/permease subunit
MTSRKDENNHWFIILAVIVIILIVLALAQSNAGSYNEREAEVKKRNEEEAKLIAELKELETKQTSYKQLEAIHAFNEKYMNELCEKRYRQLIRVLIALYLVANSIIYFTVPKMEILDLFSWNTAALSFLAVLATLFFTNVKQAKEYLKGIAMNYIEYLVYENRDKTYFTKKVQFYQTEIEKIKAEIAVKSKHLEMVKEESSKLNIN